MKREINIKTLDRALDILGLPKLVTKQEIKERYRKLAKRYHSDLEGGSNEKMQELREAYDILMKYIDSFRFRFDEEEISRQYPETHHNQKFSF